MNHSDNLESQLQDRDAILFMLNEIESLVEPNTQNAKLYERLREHFDLNMNLTNRQRQVLQNLYAKVTDIEFS